ncbi:hypothetical protein IEQ34_017811 [Dendrobium chrysotoxum]|uniref:Uncharacterized protein n=1 Tax=Dendrobium chrysotoxum TaxID=161865 RepID=A0AAV7GCG5_DENCH|nr:hypothetical protein IEQ34_017811 [Dendrobium chrysotoxum]
MEDARESRRKRLAERKTDRLAFITGQNRTLAPFAPQDAASREDITSTGTPKHYHSKDIVGNILDSSNKQEPALKPDTGGLHKFEVESENPEVAANYFSTEQKNEVAYNDNNKTRSGENISKQPFTTAMLKKPEGHDDSRATNAAQNAIFTTSTLRNISHSILATENIRLLFTIVMAILVVSSYNGFMIGGRLLSNIISFRPLFLLLLTDVTIILGWAFLNQGIGQKPEIDARNALLEDEGWPNDVAKILEVGQVLHKVLGAAFMDCSICAIIMICGIVV